jgi:hypothetical protein
LKFDLARSIDLRPYQTALSVALVLMVVASIKKYLDEWMKAMEWKRISDKEKREVIVLRENIKAKGQYFSGKLLRKNMSIKQMREKRRKIQAKRKNLRSGLQKGERQEKIADLGRNHKLLML